MLFMAATKVSSMLSSFSVGVAYKTLVQIGDKRPDLYPDGVNRFFLFVSKTEVVIQLI